MPIRKTDSNGTSPQSEPLSNPAPDHEGQTARYGQRSIAADHQNSGEPLSKRAKPDETLMLTPDKTLMERSAVPAEGIGMGARIVNFCSWVGSLFIGGSRADRLYHLVAANPDLIEKDPSCLLMKNGEQKTLVHLACENKQPDLLRRMLDSEQGRQALLEKDCEGRTPLLCAVQAGLWGACKRMIELAPETLVWPSAQQWAPFQLMISTYNLYYAQNKTFKTLNKLTKETNELRGAIELALEDKGVAEQLSAMHQYAFLEECGDPEMAAKIRKVKKQFAPAFKPVAFDANAAGNIKEATDTGSSLAALSLAGEEKSTHHEEANKKTEALNLAYNDSMAAQPEMSARKVVRGLKSVGVYGHLAFLPGETKHNFHSLGDENASLQLVHQLVKLGAPEIVCRISPPVQSDDTNFEMRQKELQDPGVRKLEREQQEVTLRKLAFLLPAFKPEKGLPQTVQVGDSQVTFVNYDDPEARSPLEIGFVEPIIIHCSTGQLPDNYINIKPYRYHSGFQSLCTDVEADGRFNHYPLNLPVNSVLPERNQSSDCLDPAQEVDPKADQGQLQKYFEECGIKNQLLANNLAGVCLRMRSGHFWASTVYGLHHPDVAYEPIITKWVRTLSCLAKRQGSDQPIVMLISQSVFNKKEDLESLLGMMQVPVIPAESSDVEHQLQQSRGPVVLVLPSLPKPAFQTLMDASNLPALVEGANTTSYLLEKAHPHLALLPQGETPVAQEMGNPLEALKAEAFSYKLQIRSPVGYAFLKKLHYLLKNEQYHAAASLVKDSSFTNSRAFDFLYREAGIDKTTGVATISFSSLLAKACQKGIGPFEREALLSAADPSIEGFAKYIESMNEEGSSTHDHFMMQSVHVGSTFNNSLIAALNRFASIKKIPL